MVLTIHFALGLLSLWLQSLDCWMQLQLQMAKGNNSTKCENNTRIFAIIIIIASAQPTQQLTHSFVRSRWFEIMIGNSKKTDYTAKWEHDLIEKKTQNQVILLSDVAFHAHYIHTSQADSILSTFFFSTLCHFCHNRIEAQAYQFYLQQVFLSFVVALFSSLLMEEMQIQSNLCGIIAKLNGKKHNATHPEWNKNAHCNHKQTKQ